MKVDIFNTDKKYNIIYADPPWKYNSRANHKTRFRGGACGHYDLMPMKDIPYPRTLPLPRQTEAMLPMTL